MRMCTCLCVCVLVAQSCPTLCDPMDYSPNRLLCPWDFPGKMEWVAIPFSKRSSQPRDWTMVSCIKGRFFTVWAIREAHIYIKRGSQVALVVENLPANARDLRDVGSISRLRRSLGEGHGNPLQYSCLENPMGRGAWQAAVHGVTESQTGPKRLSMHAYVYKIYII